MPEHDLEKLLGGFAADTLTLEEKHALYTAALEDQQLFNALADEQVLKELLCDPDVRRRLLASLEQQRASSSGTALSWLDWVLRPAGLAFAGGLSAAALALVLGVRVYQDSLDQAAQSVAIEDVKPAIPPVPTTPASQPPSAQRAEPEPKALQETEPEKEMGKKGAFLDKMTKREQSASPAPQEQRASDTTRDSVTHKVEPDEVLGKANAPVAALRKSSTEVTSSADHTLGASSPRPADSLKSKQIEAPAVSVRALFYTEVPARQGQSGIAQEKERAMKPLAESTPQENRLHGKLEGFSQLGKAAGSGTPLKPLGLRYSFVIRGVDGQEREVGVRDVSQRTQSHFLTLEANQDAYLQVWRAVDASPPQLELPEKETGQVSLKITAGQRQYMHLPVGRDPVTLTARLSLVPFGPTTKQGAAKIDRPSPHQIQESTTERNQTDSQERATYVVNQDPSTNAQITVDIILGH